MSSHQELYLKNYIYDTVIEANRKMTHGSEAYGEHDLRLVREEIERGWVCLTLSKTAQGCA